MPKSSRTTPVCYFACRASRELTLPDSSARIRELTLPDSSARIRELTLPARLSRTGEVEFMLFAVADDCIKLGLRAGAVVFRNLRIAEAPPALRADVAREVEAIRGRFDSPAAVRIAVEILGFADVLRKVGVNPRREQPSVERLLTFALKRGDLPRVNSLVDAYNLVSVRSLCSMGAHDLDRFAARPPCDC